MLEHYAPDAEVVDSTPLPDVPDTTRGHDEMRAVLDAWTEGFSGFEADVLEYVDLGDFVVCATRWRFVSSDSGIETSWTGAEAWEIRDGKIAWGQVGFRDREAALEAVRLRRAA